MKKICTRFEVSIIRVYLIAFLQHCAASQESINFMEDFTSSIFSTSKITKFSRILVTTYSNTYRPRDDPCRALETAVYWGDYLAAVGNSDRMFCY
jgi:hypothetical protein